MSDLVRPSKWLPGKPELLPCPFCACAGIKITRYIVGQGATQHDEYQAMCSNCGACGPNDLGKSGASEMWNMRHQSMPQSTV